MEKESVDNLSCEGKDGRTGTVRAQSRQSNIKYIIT